MTKQQAEFIKEACDHRMEVEIRENYSGRSMYSKTTHAVIVPSVAEMFCAVVNWMKSVPEGMDEIPDFNGTLRTDQMGRSSVVVY